MVFCFFNFFAGRINQKTSEENSLVNEADASMKFQDGYSNTSKYHFLMIEFL